MKLIETFAKKAIKSGRYQVLDQVYVENQIRALVGDEDVEVGEDADLVNQLIELAIKNQKIADDSTEKEILNDKLNDFITPLPSKINSIFWEKFNQNPQEATDWFYQLCEDNNYVKKAAIAKNIVFSGQSSAGHPLEITINLSKPEKDPKKIAQAAKEVSNKYPKCALCLENEGFLGGNGKNARSNLRIIRLSLGGRKWGMQYSPYAYFNEHCIFLDQEHIPMRINQQTLINLVEIVRQFPQYFVGSNADLPIVGGSMLAHEHYQGGRHIFPMMKAKIKQELNFDNFPEVEAGVVDWPMTDIRLASSDSSEIIKLGTKIIDYWNHYSDPSLQINCGSETDRHHTVTPILHFEDNKFILDLVLRDNNTSDQYPLGIFHPHEEYWHIKKENIGLIEVMGRAILPGRLKRELNEVKKYLLGEENEMDNKHLAWAKQIKQNNDITQDNVSAVLRQALIDVFDQVLTCAGVFKNDPAGQKGLDKFLDSLRKVITNEN